MKKDDSVKQAKFMDNPGAKGIWFGDESVDYACGYAMKDQGVVMGLRKKGNTGSMDLAVSMSETGVTVQVVKADGVVKEFPVCPEKFANLLLAVHGILEDL